MCVASPARCVKVDVTQYGEIHSLIQHVRTSDRAERDTICRIEVVSELGCEEDLVPSTRLCKPSTDNTLGCGAVELLH